MSSSSSTIRILLLLAPVSVEDFAAVLIIVSADERLFSPLSEDISWLVSNIFDETVGSYDNKDYSE
jgi:hypothetical protein